MSGGGSKVNTFASVGFKSRKIILWGSKVYNFKKLLMYYSFRFDLIIVVGKNYSFKIIVVLEFQCKIY